MGGTGMRFHDSLPKQFHPLEKGKVYLKTLEAFLTSGLFNEIILVCVKEWCDQVRKEVGSTARVVEGGRTRQESSLLGLQACDLTTDIALIHDAVRPFVSIRILEENIEGAKLYGAVDTCIPSSDTIVYAPGGEKIASIPKRAEYLRGQTPQTFSYPLILEAHQKTKKTDATDDCQLVLELGAEIHIVHGDEENRKITTKRDLLGVS
ncbi:MAG: putative ribitol-5-phosphate cytidylyltransferase [Chlamydiae bacterium]|nr:putative ribitol-5-phosphate cytidylyltransferase [Chlamydiota bacterium]